MPILRTDCSATYTTPSGSTVVLPVNCAGADSEDWNWKYFWVKTLGTNPVKVQAQDTIREANRFMYVEGEDTVGAGQNYQIVIRSMFAYIADEQVPVKGTADMYMEFFSNTPLLDSATFEVYTKVFNLDGSLYTTIFNENVVVSNPATYTINGSEQRTFTGYLPATTCPLVCFSWMRSVGVATSPIESKTITGNFKLNFGVFPEEIAVERDGVNIPLNSTFDLGNVYAGYNLNRTFTIQNYGSSGLALLGNPKVLLSGDTVSFSISSQPAGYINQFTNTAFTVEFGSNTTGTKQATITIPNSDSDKNPFVFNITGTVDQSGEIQVEQPANTILANNSTKDFGSVSVNSSKSLIFTIRNTASPGLILSGQPRVEVFDGPNQGDFLVTSYPAVYVLPNSSTVFSVQFTARGPGTRSAALRIINSDGDENPFIINLTGTGV